MGEVKPKIIVAGMMNTKGTEIKFLVGKVKEAGGIPIVMDVTLGEKVEYDWVDITPEQILVEIGMTAEELRSLPRGEAGNRMEQAGRKRIRALFENRQVDGVIGYAGGMGTSVITGMMRELPVGVPKIILSSVANAGFSTAHFFGSKDIYMANPIFEAGMNPITRRILNNGAYAVVGMAKGNCALKQEQDKISIGYVMLGITTPCVLRASGAMEEKGYESMIVHGVGETIESLIKEGCVSGLMDITPNDIALNAVRPETNPERMSVAAKCGIPQVIAPGGLDLMVVMRDSVPDWLKEQIENGHPERGLYPHVSNAYAVGTSSEECVRSGVTIAQRINGATAPVAVCVPLQGLSSADCGKADLARGWSGPGACPVWVADPENERHSLRSKKFLEGFLSAVDRENQYIRVFTVDAHINDPEFAAFCSFSLHCGLCGQRADIAAFGGTVREITF